MFCVLFAVYYDYLRNYLLCCSRLFAIYDNFRLLQDYLRLFQTDDLKLFVNCLRLFVRILGLLSELLGARRLFVGLFKIVYESLQYFSDFWLDYLWSVKPFFANYLKLFKMIVDYLQTIRDYFERLIEMIWIMLKLFKRLVAYYLRLFDKLLNRSPALILNDWEPALKT